MTAVWLTGPALEVVRTLPDSSVDLVATSPPFLALRDYNGVPGQWGSEATPAAFLDNLLELATELRRVLAPHGSLAFELGDTYCGAGGYGSPDSLNPAYGASSKREGHFTNRTAKRFKRKDDGWPPAKSLCLVPTLFAASLAYGRNLLNPCHTFDPWLVRNVIVWARNNPPVGALGDKVRPATSYITVACPSPRRWFDLDAVRTQTPRHMEEVARGKLGKHGSFGADPNRNHNHGRDLYVNAGNPAGAPPLDHWHDESDGDHTWLINTQGSSLAHYAMWPSRLAERLVLAMCPREVCRTCGEPRRRLTGPAEYVKDGGAPAARLDDRWRHGRVGLTGDALQKQGHLTRIAPTLGWSDCGHDDYRPGIVLDPFSGTGTTIHAAEVHGRDGIGIDLDPINATLRDRRRDEVRRNLLGVAPEVPGQLTLGAML